jgi:hypothetical protein
MGSFLQYSIVRFSIFVCHSCRCEVCLELNLTGAVVWENENVSDAIESIIRHPPPPPPWSPVPGSVVHMLHVWVPGVTLISMAGGVQYVHNPSFGQ